MRTLSPCRPNLRDVAKAAGVSGVSIAAVSLALNHKPGVSQALIRRVSEIAVQLGYQRDAKMSELMAHVSGRRRQHDDYSTLALITQHERPGLWEVDTSLFPLRDGARKRAEALGYKLEEFRCNEPGMTPDRLRGILLYRNIKGLIFATPQRRAPDGNAPFDLTGFSAATCDLHFQAQAMSYIAPDLFTDVHTCLQRAYHLGYRRPLLALHGTIATRASQLMQGACLSFAYQHPDVARLPFYVGDCRAFASLQKHLEKTPPRCRAVLRTHPLRQPGGWLGLDHPESVARRKSPRRFGSYAAASRRVGGGSCGWGLHRIETASAQPHQGVLSPDVFHDGPSLPPKSQPTSPPICVPTLVTQPCHTLELVGHAWT